MQHSSIEIQRRRRQVTLISRQCQSTEYSVQTMPTDRQGKRETNYCYSMQNAHHHHHRRIYLRRSSKCHPQVTTVGAESVSGGQALHPPAPSHPSAKRHHVHRNLAVQYGGTKSYILESFVYSQYPSCARPSLDGPRRILEPHALQRRSRRLGSFSFFLFSDLMYSAAYMAELGQKTTRYSL